MSSILETVLLADDQPMFRHGLASLLRNRFDTETVIAIGDWPDTLDALRNNQATQIAIIDLELSGMPGVAGIRQIRTCFPDVLVMVVSALRGRQRVLDIL